jgi:hypothetical protein
MSQNASIVPPDEMPRKPAAPVVSIGPFAAIAPRTLSLGVAFEYPQNWQVGEERRQQPPFQQLIILGPRNAADSYTAGIIVRVLPVKARGGEYASLQELAAWRRTQYASASGVQFTRDEVVSRFGGEGRELELQYGARVGRQTAGTSPITLKHHFVMVARGDTLYEFAFSADALEYDLYHPAFARLLESIRFPR